MSSKNLVILIGRVGKDPEVKTTTNGKVASLTLATTEYYKDKATGEKKEQTDWHNIVFWNSVADIVEKYVNKGSLINVDGKIRTRSYDDKEGVKRYVTEIIGNQLTLLGGKQEGAKTGESLATTKPEAVSTPAPVGNDSDELPF
jgi:single-strand DNA-binding protein